MNAELKQKWLEALRGDDYEQTTEVLCDGEAYCCLGVLADIIDPKGWEGNRLWWWNYKDYDPDIDAETYETNVPDSIISNEIQDVLISMNDVEGASFATIADYIEKAVLAE